MPDWFLPALALAVGYLLGRRGGYPAPPAPVNVTFNVPVRLEDVGIVVPDEAGGDDEDGPPDWTNRFSNDN